MKTHILRTQNWIQYPYLIKLKMFLFITKSLIVKDIIFNENMSLRLYYQLLHYLHRTYRSTYL